jgi:hypothetical protein
MARGVRYDREEAEIRQASMASFIDQNIGLDNLR